MSGPSVLATPRNGRVLTVSGDPDREEWDTCTVHDVSAFTRGGSLSTILALSGVALVQIKGLSIWMAWRLMSAAETFTVLFATRQIPPALECAAWSEAATDAVFATKIGLRILRANTMILTKLPFNDASARRRAARHNTGDLVFLGREVYGSSKQGLLLSQGV